MDNLHKHLIYYSPTFIIGIGPPLICFAHVQKNMYLINYHTLLLRDGFSREGWKEVCVYVCVQDFYLKDMVILVELIERIN